MAAAARGHESSAVVTRSFWRKPNESTCGGEGHPRCRSHKRRSCRTPESHRGRFCCLLCALLRSLLRQLLEVSHLQSTTFVAVEYMIQYMIALLKVRQCMTHNSSIASCSSVCRDREAGRAHCEREGSVSRTIITAARHARYGVANLLGGCVGTSVRRDRVRVRASPSPHRLGCELEVG